ncbi:uncharacterized protein HLK63_L14993 [Nakaseomyces glabratus]|nr:hypothetical protein B1J91_L11000g [Nakaseomyces glabratus]OXB46499.1 hypothetical protein B1J92_L11000g [Nakaseomyces glabratus]UCS23240.1 uncharacterized protein GW608_L14993 [Nakaseomyces glabratus]UCS28472.1 uncharacterized protein HLK63_L14993 [Nakaseomyces glabratus]UCS33701.1 uncharacterized protein HLK64_L14993 [Nakaseomyces glabratus]
MIFTKPMGHDSRLHRVLLLKNMVDGGNDPYTKKIQEHQDSFEEPIFLPLITHTNVPQNIISRFADRADNLQDDYDFLIITSQRSIECLNLPELKHIRNKLIDKPTYTVGPATSNFLSSLGFTDIRGGIHAGNGMKLASIIDNDYPAGGKALFLVGEIRKDIIPKYLRPRNFTVDEIIMYKTAELSDSIVWFKSYLDKCDWIVVFSPQGMSDILQYMKQYTQGARPFKIACIGPTTCEFLNSNGIEPDLVSPKPDANSLIAAIKEYEVINRLSHSNGDY